VNAINALEGTFYHQGGQTVDDYLDNFQALVSNAGYTDPRTLVVKFRRGLRLGIQNQIATMPYRRPADTDPDVWYRAAWRIDQARLTNEAFQSVSRTVPCTAQNRLRLTLTFVCGKVASRSIRSSHSKTSAARSVYGNPYGRRHG